MALAISCTIWSITNPSIPAASSLNAYCKPFSSHFSCKNPHTISLHAHTNTVADDVLADIQNSGVIACLRAKSAEVAIEAASAAIKGGIKALEITMSTPGVFEILQYLVQEYPSASLGVGTVLDRADANDALKFGAKFLMSPVMVKEIIDDVSNSQALYIPGAMTPTEILYTAKAGARIVKVYPVSALGGIHYIAAIKKPFPRIPLVASQGIKIESVGEYIAQGVSSVVLSDAIFDKVAMDQQNFDRINQLACQAALEGNKAVRKIRDKFS